MGEDVCFKGVNGQLQLVINKAENFGRVLEKLRAKLSSGGEFFPPGTVITLPPTVNLIGNQMELIAGLLAEHGLVCERSEPPARDPADEPATTEREGYEIQALVVARTLRNGQKVTYDGSVVVIGDVNPGAQVIAGGDIIILGACRGLAHAGAGGNEAATITAGKILATQLRIAGVIARSPDKLDEPAYLATARIEDGAVVIEPANR